MAVGTVLFVPFSLGDLQATAWSSVRLVSWVCVVFSSLLALNFAYTAWYHGVRHLGSSRTALYSNLVPAAALLVAMLWLGERIEGMRLVGAALVLIGVVITRVPKGLGGLASSVPGTVPGTVHDDASRARSAATREEP
jgi:drug/metabolite transporter (DMT)-like permease